MASQQRTQRHPDGNPAPSHEVGFGEWYSDDEEETGPWCVDHGHSMEVLRTREIHRRLHAGDLGPEVKVWRDGRACWLPLCECYELTATPPPVVVSTPTWTPPPMQGVADEGSLQRRPTRPGGYGIRRLSAIVLAAFVVGVGFGALVYLPEATASGISEHPNGVNRAFDPIRRLARRLSSAPQPAGRLVVRSRSGPN